MTLDEARTMIGAGVVYRPSIVSRPEQGIVTSVNDWYVFVRYGSDSGSKATPAGFLTPLAPA